MIWWFSWGFWSDSLKNLLSVFLKRLSFLSQSLVILRTSSFMLRRLSNLTLWKQIVSQSRIHSTTLFPLSLNYRAIIVRRENVQVIESWELIYFWSRYIVLQTVSDHHFLRDFPIKLVERLSKVKVVLLIHCVMSIFVDTSVKFIEILKFISSKIHTASCLELIELILWTNRHWKMIFQLSLFVLFIIHSSLKRLSMLVLFRVRLRVLMLGHSFQEILRELTS